MTRSNLEHWDTKTSPVDNESERKSFQSPLTDSENVNGDLNLIFISSVKHTGKLHRDECIIIPAWLMATIRKESAMFCSLRRNS